MTKYDPRKCGAKCDVCPLGPKGALRDWSQPWKPVPPEHHEGARAVLVSDMPAGEDVKWGHPFASPETGGPWNRVLRRMGESRNDYGIVNVIACGSAGNASGMYQRLNDKVKRLNKSRAATGKSAVPHPEDCCKPRLMKDIERYSSIITAGKVATKAITGVTRGIDKVRGSPWALTEEGKKCSWDDEAAITTLLPTYNPKRIQSNPVLFNWWHHDLEKARRLRENRLRWEDPSSVLWRPSPAEFRAWRKSIQPTFHEGRKGAHRFTAPVVCGDVETPRHPQGMRPRHIPTRTISFARWKNGVEGGDVELACISILSADGKTRFYSPSEEAEIVAEINALHEDESILKIGHNWLAFDCENIEANFGAMPRNNLDTLAPARAANPSISKGLKPVGRTYSDVGEWDSDDKEDSIATGSTNDDELLKYNGTDVHVNLVIWPTIRRLAAAAGYFDPIDERYLSLDWWPGARVPTLCDIDHWRHDRALRCTRVGLWIDQVKREELEKKFTAEYEAIFDRLQHLLERHGVSITDSDIKGDDLNPNSTQALRWLYFEKWDLPALWANGMKDEDGEPLYKKKDFVTNNGDRSTSDIVHRHYIASGVLEDYQAEIMQLVRVYRRYRGKIVGTTLKPLAPAQPIIETRGKNRGSIKGYTKSWLYEDGRVHSKFSNLITSVGRWNSSGPNCYSGDTEVLTDRGWLRFDDLAKTDMPKFVTWQPDGSMRWEEATEYHRYEGAEFMSIKTDLYIDLMVTPDHGCPVFSRKTGKFRVVEAKDYPRDALQPVAGTLSDGHTLPENRVKFVVALQADGQITNHHVRFGFNKKRKVERLRNILQALELNFSEDVYGKTTEFRIPFSSNPELGKLWRGCLDEEKRFSPALLQLSEESRRVFLAEVMQWDGCYTRNNHYASKHKVNADIVQALYNITGHGARVRKYTNSHGSVSWQVDVRWGKQTVGAANNLKQSELNQTAYCVTVPSKFLMVRRNNVSLISKNTQNIGNKKGQGPLKKVFAAPAGRIFYGADINQAHLFIIANVWKIPALCEAIRKGYDPHNYNAYTTFGKKFTGAPGYNGLKHKPDPGSVADAMRNTIKIFIYASVYGASPSTVWSVLAATEFDLAPNWLGMLKDGNIWRVPWKEGEEPMPLNVYHFIREAMPYIDMKPSQVAKLHEAWLKGQPEWVDAWQREIDFYKTNGFVQSYLFKRNSGDLGDDQNKMINTATLMTESEIMLMIEGRIEKEFPRDSCGPGTGFVYQCHDSAAVEWALPKGLPAFWKPGKGMKRSDLPREIRDNVERFEAAFTLNIPGWEFPIKGEAEVGRTLKEVT